MLEERQHPLRRKKIHSLDLNKKRLFSATFRKTLFNAVITHQSTIHEIGLHKYQLTAHQHSPNIQIDTAFKNIFIRTCDPSNLNIIISVGLLYLPAASECERVPIRCSDLLRGSTVRTTHSFREALRPLCLLCGTYSTRCYLST